MTEESKRPILKLSIVKTSLENLQKTKPSIKYEKIKEEKPKTPKYFVFDPQELGHLYKLVREKFPNTFPPKDQTPKILAIGIHKALVEALNLPMIKAKSFCRIYCKRKEYLEARVKGTPRYDLNGTVVGEV